jgi:hypothetical protein
MLENRNFTTDRSSPHKLVSHGTVGSVFYADNIYFDRHVQVSRWLHSVMWLLYQNSYSWLNRKGSNTYGNHVYWKGVAHHCCEIGFMYVWTQLIYSWLQAKIPTLICFNTAAWSTSWTSFDIMSRVSLTGEKINVGNYNTHHMVWGKGHMMWRSHEAHCAGTLACWTTGLNDLVCTI